jgi:hypothetical protein
LNKNRLCSQITVQLGQTCVEQDMTQRKEKGSER